MYSTIFFLNVVLRGIVTILDKMYSFPVIDVYNASVTHF